MSPPYIDEHKAAPQQGCYIDNSPAGVLLAKSIAIATLGGKSIAILIGNDSCPGQRQPPLSGAPVNKMAVNYHEGKTDPSGFRVWWNSSSLQDISVPSYRQLPDGLVMTTTTTTNYTVYDERGLVAR